MAFIDSLTQQYGSTIGLKLGGEQVVLTGDPHLSRQVLIDQADVFGKVIFTSFAVCCISLPLHAGLTALGSVSVCAELLAYFQCH